MLWFAQGSASCRRRFPTAVVCSRVRELQDALSAGTIALEISSRNARVAAPQGLDRLRAALDLILDQRGADMADLPQGRQRVALPDYKCKEAAVSRRCENISILERDQLHQDDLVR
jgi:hypothetical protein